ncbi:MAG TPA: glycoside hydrolase family 76 protein [Acidimicrobiales bacterium]|nr:glycoside hydrolase family 76 protein [Acidimicrobiales bacterium]
MRTPRRRRRWLAVLLLLVAVAALESIPGVPGHDQAALVAELAVADAGGAARTLPPFRVDATGQPCAIIETRYGVGNHLLRNRAIGWYASIWPSYHALDALSLASLVPGRTACAEAVEADLSAIDANYWDESPGPVPPAFDQGPNPFHVRSDPPRVDDSLWMGLALVAGYSETGRRPFLDRAEAVLRLAGANWDPRRGGVYWEDHTGRATNQYKSLVSNAPAVVLGADLYLDTGDARYLDRSRQIYSWLQANLRDPRTGLYDDGVDDHTGVPKVKTTKLTYNQGIMLGAMVALSTVDPKAYPLHDALRFAEGAMAYFAAHGSYGQPGFDSIWGEELLCAAGRAGDAGFTHAALASVRAAIRRAPGGAGDLLGASSETALHELARLPSSGYTRLPACDVRRH